MRHAVPGDKVFLLAREGEREEGREGGRERGREGEREREREREEERKRERDGGRSRRESQMSRRERPAISRKATSRTHRQGLRLPGFAHIPRLRIMKPLWLAPAQHHHVEASSVASCRGIVVQRHRHHQTEGLSVAHRSPKPTSISSLGRREELGFRVKSGELTGIRLSGRTCRAPAGRTHTISRLCECAPLGSDGGHFHCRC